ncbi:phospholipase B1, membrane-associated-like [Anneissia japonica]|uniref:phospholipase B1, membrane-associated-like n=1 Tax=Anneissia japonica TaxID=1529436 RepID=UPI001425A4AB|nr:phospholipase B1, membrane-associated-like [Anneissia japonica]
MATLRFILFSLLLIKVQCITLNDKDKNMINRLAEYVNSEDCDDVVNTKTTETTGISFDCKVFSSQETLTSVHQLTAADIKVVAAIGDSMTAANGAGSDSITDTLTEYRELSFSAGGQGSLESMVTLPNILKKYNPSLKGFSTTGSIGFNVAESGATTDELTCQVGELIDMMKADSSIDYENDWKVVTIFIGTNDLCHYCLNEEDSSPANYISSMYEGLELLKDEMPRTFVNIVSPTNVYDLSTMASQNSVCTTVYMKSCPCVAAGGAILDKVNEAALKYQGLLSDMIATGRYEKDDFAVVLQPFLQKASMPMNKDGTVDMSLMAADCIHLSQKGQAMYGLALWQSMFQSTSAKATNLQSALRLVSYNSLDGQELACPSEQQFFATNTNSESMSANAVNTNAVDTDSSSSSSTSVIVAVSLVGGCVCLVAVVFGVMVFRRVRKRQGYSEPDGHPMSSTGGYSYTKFS